VEHETVFRRLRRALRRHDRPEIFRATRANCNKGLQNTAPPKPSRIEILKRVRRATIEDQLHLLDWLETKYAKTRLAERKREK